MSSIYGGTQRRTGPDVYGQSSSGSGSGSAAIQAATDPTIADSGYELGQTWVNTVTDAPFILTDVTGGVATWEQLATGTDLSLYTLVDGTRPFTGTIGGVNPVAASDLATKNYVDNAANGVILKDPVEVATTADLGATYNSTGGTSGTGQFTSGPLSIDGVTLLVSDRVLVKDQTDNKQNGIYVVTSVAPTSTLERATDHDTSAEVLHGDRTLVLTGTVSMGSTYAITTNDPITLNTTGIDWVLVGFNDHGALTGLADDDHTQYALLAGRSGGQTLTGGTVTTQGMTLTPNSADATGAVTVTGTDQSTDKDTGSLIVEGGVGIEKDVFIGGELNVTTIEPEGIEPLLIGPNVATKVEIADTGIITEIQGPLLGLSSVDIVGTLLVDDIDTKTVTTLLLGRSTATKVEIADMGVTTEMQGPLTALEGLGVSGNETITGYIQFTDMASPVNPSAGEGRLYKKTGDDGIFWRPDAAGPEIDLTDTGIADHGGLTGLGDDDHTQYALLAGRAGGQTFIGGSAASESLTLESTSDGTKGTIDLNDPTRVDDIDTLTATTLLLGKDIATKIELADTGVTTEAQGPLTALEGLGVTGNVTVTGTVDGRDVATDGSTQDTHIADGTIHFTEASIDHGSIAGLGDDDHTQYTLLAGRAGGQDIIGGTAASEGLTLESTSDGTKGTIDLKGPTRVDDIDTLTATTLLLGKDTATKIELADTGVTTEAQGPLTALEGASVTGNIIVSGTVDGRDIATDGSTQDTHIADGTIHFTEASIDHGSIAGLGDDDHTQYALLAGRSGGQTIIGGTAAGDDLILQSTSNGTKGNVQVTEATASSSTSTGALVITGGVGIGGTVNAAQVSVDQVSINDGVVTYSGTTGNNQIVVPDNLADAFSIQEGTNKYITLQTTDSNERVSLLKAINMVSAAIPGTPAEGDIYYDATDDVFKYRNATQFNNLGSVSVLEEGAVPSGGTAAELYDTIDVIGTGVTATRTAAGTVSINHIQGSEFNSRFSAGPFTRSLGTFGRLAPGTPIINNVSLPIGQYVIMWNLQWKRNTGNPSLDLNILTVNDDTATVTTVYAYSQALINNNNDQAISGFAVVNFTTSPTTRDFDIEYANPGSGTILVEDVYMAVWRISGSNTGLTSIV